jgi:hypothetical protein
MDMDNFVEAKKDFTKSIENDNGNLLTESYYLRAKCK